MRRLCLTLAVALCAAPAAALSTAHVANAQVAPPFQDPNAVVAKMIGHQPALESCRSRVHVDVRMLNFPYLSPTLDGTSYCRHSGSYEVVFDRVPFYAKSFSRLFDDIGDPAAWGKDHNIAIDGMQTVDGRSLIVLRLTKKIHSTILDHVLAFVDPSNYELLRMEWDYTSGGKIVMAQTYRVERGFTVLASQHATIEIPHVRAVADAQYGPYKTDDARR